MLTARVRKARYKDIGIIAENMRQTDIDEVWASDHLTPFQALDKSYNDSVICMTIEYLGKPIGIFGVVPHTLIGKAGNVWLLGTNDMCNINRRLLRYSKRFINILLSYYPYLTNYVSVKNTASIKWLRLSGAVFSDPAPYGAEQQLFQRFEFRRV